MLWQPPPPGQGEEGTIEKVLERRNLLYRQDEIRTKTFAANIDQVLVLIAAEPVFSESQLARALIAAEDAGITPSLRSTSTIWKSLCHGLAATGGLPRHPERGWQRALPYHPAEPDQR